MPVYQIRQILQWANYRGIYVRGYSTMKKADLIDEICRRLDEPEIFKGVINRLRIEVEMNRYHL
jgi:hypothetical protein